MLRYQSVFHFGSAQSVTANVDDVVHPSRDLVIAVSVPDSPITSEIEAAEWVIISRKETVVMTVNCSRHPGP